MRALQRLREGRRLARMLKNENPRHLSRRDYEDELEAQAAVLVKVMRDDDAPAELEVLRMRAEAARRHHYDAAPEPTLDQQAGRLSEEARRMANRGFPVYGRGHAMTRRDQHGW